jgi:hydroxymethylbilane synthase
LRALRLGTRGSRLARVQTREAEQVLAAAGAQTETVVCRTLGDQQAEVPLDAIAGPGVFARAIEEALIDEDIDVAVHSAKDLGIDPLEGTALVAYLPRGDVRDALVSNNGSALAMLPQGARIGTSSRRRAAQIRALRPDFETANIRGNIDTRIEKVQRGNYDATLLAVAGLARLGRLDVVADYLAIDQMLPAPAQGAIVLQARCGDDETVALLRSLNHRQTAVAVRAERAVLSGLGAGCALPVAALGYVRGQEVALVGSVWDERTGQSITVQRTGSVEDPEAVGSAVASALRERGAEALLSESVS